MKAQGGDDARTNLVIWSHNLHWRRGEIIIGGTGTLLSAMTAPCLRCALSGVGHANIILTPWNGLYSYPSGRIRISFVTR